MTIEKRNEIAELVLFLGWYRHKNNDYDYDSITKEISDGMNSIIDNPFLNRVYLMVYGSNFPEMRRYNISVLLFGLKLKDELDFIQNRLFSGKLKEFEEFVIPILQRIGWIHQIDQLQEFDFHVHDQILFNFNIEVRDNDPEMDYFVDLFSNYDPNFSKSYWLNDLFSDSKEKNRVYGLVIDLISFFLGSCVNEAHHLIGTQIAYSPFLLKSIKNKIDDLGYSIHPNEFSYSKVVLNLYVFFHFKKEIILIFLLIKDCHQGMYKPLRKCYFRSGHDFFFNMLKIKAAVSEYSYTRIVDPYGEDYLLHQEVPDVLFEFDPHIELLSFSDFASRYFLEIPEL